MATKTKMPTKSEKPQKEEVVFPTRIDPRLERVELSHVPADLAEGKVDMEDVALLSKLLITTVSTLRARAATAAELLKEAGLDPEEDDRLTKQKKMVEDALRARILPTCPDGGLSWKCGDTQVSVQKSTETLSVDPSFLTEELAGQVAAVDAALIVLTLDHHRLAEMLADGSFPKELRQRLLDAEVIGFQRRAPTVTVK